MNPNVIVDVLTETTKQENVNKSNTKSNSLAAKYTNATKNEIVVGGEVSNYVTPRTAACTSGNEKMRKTSAEREALKVTDSNRERKIVAETDSGVSEKFECAQLRIQNTMVDKTKEEKFKIDVEVGSSSSSILELSSLLRVFNTLTWLKTVYRNLC